MSIKRSWIAIRYWLTKRWRIYYCCIALTCFAFILITSKNEMHLDNQLINTKLPTTLKHSLLTSSSDDEQYLKHPIIKNDQELNLSITNRLNNMIFNSWSKLNNYYTSYYGLTKTDQQDESNLITLFSSTKFQKFNEIDFEFNQPVVQLNISDQLKSQLDFVVRRVIEYHENNFDLHFNERINKNNLTINLIKQMINKQEKRSLTISYTDQWQPVIGPKEKSRVYSAYYEPRLESGKFVRVIAAARTANSEPLFCAFWFIDEASQSLKLQMTPAINRAIRENWNLKYSAYYLLCPLANNQIPIAVSILKKKLPLKKQKENEDANDEEDSLVFHALGNFVLVQNNLKYKEASNEDKIAICVKPLHYEYNKLDNLIEFIELNQLLGIDHFLFYNHTIGSKVDCLLNYFRKRTNLITVLPWHNLDMKSQEEIRTEGIFASLNDCLYRTMFRFKYVAMIDLDEFIIPHLDSNLKVLLKRLTNLQLAKDQAGAFSFQNAFFYLQWTDDPEYLKLTKQQLSAKSSEKLSKKSNKQPFTLSTSTAKAAADHLLPVYLTTLAKTRRRAILHSHRERSKLIVIPEHTVEVGNHFVWQFLVTKSAFHINERAAYLHHYRVCEFGGRDCLDSQSILDHRTQHWSKQLIQKSISTFKIYNQTCV